MNQSERPKRSVESEWPSLPFALHQLRVQRMESVFSALDGLAADVMTGGRWRPQRKTRMQHEVIDTNIGLTPLHAPPVFRTVTFSAVRDTTK